MNLKHWGVALFLLPILIFLAGCSTHTLEHRTHESYDFSRLKRVAIIYPTIDDAATTEAQRILSRQIADEMQRKGYRVTADRADADFIITFHIGATGKRHLSNDYRLLGIVPSYYSPYYGHYGYHYVVGKSTQSHTYTEGKIIVEAIDPKQNNLVFWNAKMTDRLKAHKNREERDRYLRGVVQKVFASFPAASHS